MSLLFNQNTSEASRWPLLHAEQSRYFRNGQPAGRSQGRGAVWMRCHHGLLPRKLLRRASNRDRAGLMQVGSMHARKIPGSARRA